MPALLLVVFVFYAQIITRKLAVLTRRTSPPFLPDSHTMLIKLKDIRSHWGNRRVNKYVSCSYNPLFVCIVGTRRHACMQWGWALPRRGTPPVRNAMCCLTLYEVSAHMDIRLFHANYSYQDVVGRWFLIDVSDTRCFSKMSEYVCVT